MSAAFGWFSVVKTGRDHLPFFENSILYLSSRVTFVQRKKKSVSGLRFASHTVSSDWLSSIFSLWGFLCLSLSRQKLETPFPENKNAQYAC